MRMTGDDRLKRRRTGDLPMRAILLAAALLVLRPARAPAAGSEGSAVQGAPRAASDSAPPGAPSDSLRVRGPIQVRGGRRLSTGDVRDALAGAAGDSRAAVARGKGTAVLGREEIHQALSSLGDKLVDAGFLEADVELESPPGERTILHVREGPQARWDTLLVRVPSDSLTATAPGELAHPAGVPVRIGVPSGRFSPRRLEKLLWDWVDLWNENGHPFAEAVVESCRVEDGRVRAAVRFNPGPQLRVAQVEFPGKTTTRDTFLRRWIRFRPGALYRESEWQARRRRLEQAGLFVGVGDPTLQPGPDGLRVAFPVEEEKHNLLDGAIGYSGLTRTFSGFGDLQLGDLFGTGRQLGFRWERLQKSQSRLRLEYREPLLGPLPAGVRLSLEQEVQDSLYTLAVWQGTLEAMVGWDLTAFGGAEYRRSVIGPVPSELSRRLSSVFGGRWNTIRPGRFRGGSLEASFRSGQSRVRPAGGGPVQSSLLNRASIEGERFWPLGNLILRGRTAAAGLSRSDSLPITEALRIGGSTTLRGYGDEQFATLRYLIIQLEVGVALPDARAYVFADAGWFRNFAPPFRSSDAAGFGAGVTSVSAGREVGIDLGVPRGGTLREARLHVRVVTRF